MAAWACLYFALHHRSLSQIDWKLSTRFNLSLTQQGEYEGTGYVRDHVLCDRLWTEGTETEVLSMEGCEQASWTEEETTWTDWKPNPMCVKTRNDTMQNSKSLLHILNLSMSLFTELPLSSKAFPPSSNCQLGIFSQNCLICYSTEVR